MCESVTGEPGQDASRFLDPHGLEPNPFTLAATSLDEEGKEVQEAIEGWGERQRPRAATSLGFGGDGEGGQGGWDVEESTIEFTSSMSIRCGWNAHASSEASGVPYAYSSSCNRSTINTRMHGADIPRRYSYNQRRSLPRWSSRTDSMVTTGPWILTPPYATPQHVSHSTHSLVLCSLPCVYQPVCSLKSEQQVFRV